MDILEIAIYWERWKLVEYLVNKSPNANYSHIGRAIYEIICSKYAGKYMLAKRLVDKCAKEESLNWSDSNGYTALHMLAFQIKYLVEKKEESFIGRIFDRYTLLQTINLTNHLIEKGADPDYSPTYFEYDGYPSRRAPFKIAFNEFANTLKSLDRYPLF